jgi:hypothetical protein
MGLVLRPKSAVIDIEARCVLDLEKVGAVRWIKRAEPLCAGYAIDDRPGNYGRLASPCLPILPLCCSTRNI